MLIPLTSHPTVQAVAATLVLTAMLASVSWIDARTRRIPDRLSLPLIGLGLCWAAVQPEREFLPHLIGAIVGYGLLAGIGAVYFRKRGQEGLGLGDAKLFGAAGAWLGWQALPQVLLIAATAGLVFALSHRIVGSPKNVEIAFGPWLALGLWLVWMVQLFWPAAWFVT